MRNFERDSNSNQQNQNLVLETSSVFGGHAEKKPKENLCMEQPNTINNQQSIYITLNSMKEMRMDWEHSTKK